VARDQLTEGHALEKFLFLYPAIFLDNSLLHLARDGRAAIGSGSQFQESPKKKT
jgi:hypothetical protein